MPDKFRILSIDGGGMRGIVPVTILKSIEKQTGKRIFELFDLIAGTSTGALIACALTVSDDGKTPKYTLDDIEKMYTEKGEDIFPHFSKLGRLEKDVTNLFKPLYSAKGLYEVISQFMGNKKMSHCLRPLFIPSYDIESNTAVIFKSRNITDEKQPIDPLLYDVCRATTAAPTFLPAYSFNYNGKPGTFIDGGVYMNNPSVGAIVEATKYGHEACYRSTYSKPAVQLSDICLLSLGTGHYQDGLMYKKVSNAGELGWASTIPDLMMQGVNETTCYEANELLEEGNFLRLNIKIDDPAHDNMTDASAETMDYLIAEVNKQLLQNEEVDTAITSFIHKLN
jgi:patatin-like phospholipase/acyl hydrolase